MAGKGIVDETLTAAKFHPVHKVINSQIAKTQTNALNIAYS